MHGIDLRGVFYRFRGLPATAAQRLQRLTWLLSFPPHLGQRRLFCCITNFVRGRIPMAVGVIEGGVW